MWACKIYNGALKSTKTPTQKQKMERVKSMIV